MKKILLVACLFTAFYSKAQLTTLPSGSNKPAAVSEQIGLTKVTIHYDRPAVKGREGKIWGQLVPIGFTDQGFGNTKAAPWRAGANENTTISFSTDVQVEGQPLAAGTYGLFIAYNPAESIVIFSKNSNSWGSYYYNPAEDALRVKIKPQPLSQSVEWLQYQFINQTGNSATISMQWEKLSFPFTVSVDINQTQVASFRNELRSEKGFTWQAWEQAAQWCVQNNTNLEEALLWADSATSTTFGGNFAFQSHSTKAMVLDKLGRADEANTILKNALPLANMQEMHQFGRRLLTQKKAKEALEIFKTNYTKNPNQFTTLMGLTRGYAANADYKNALKYALQALALAPDSNNRNFVESAIAKLKEGKDIN